jgi:hypothetical protein
LGRFLEIDAASMKWHQSLLLEQKGVQGVEKEKIISVGSQKFTISRASNIKRFCQASRHEGLTIFDCRLIIWVKSP